MDQVEQSSNDSLRSGQHPRLGPAPPKPAVGKQHQSFWLWVMCLTGVDYFSTLGYLPSIAYRAVGYLAPIATIILVVVTLLGALPIYAYVAKRSPKGLGSIALLEKLVAGWAGKFLVLALLGFVATAFIFTKTLSASDAAEHLIHNPVWTSVKNSFLPPFMSAWFQNNEQVVLTMILLIVLGGVFLRGFREVIGLAVLIVGVFLTLNLIIIISGIVYLVNHDYLFEYWFRGLHNPELWYGAKDSALDYAPWGVIIGVCLLNFPKLALGLSGFETGLMVMPLIRGEKSDTEEKPEGRIRNTRKLLITAAIIMCFFLLGSSLVTSTLITPEEHASVAKNRALAFLAHGSTAGHGPEHDAVSDKNINPAMFGEVFGTIYDLCTVIILWFAGASALAGLLNLVPQYLPRYGMAPDWARAIKPLILLFTAISLFVVWIVSADVDAQDAPYATGVLVFIFSGCIATLIHRWRSQAGTGFSRIVYYVSLFVFGVITLVFFYTTIQIIREKPTGIIIAGIIILAITVTSLLSRTARSRELRFTGFEFEDDHSKFLWESLQHLEFPVLVPHRPSGSRGLAEKEEIIRVEHRLTPDVPVVFIEVELGDPSEFYQRPRMEIIQEEGRFIIRVKRCTAVANSIAALGLELSKVGKPPEIHFGWSDVSPVAGAIGFILFGEGNVPWMVRELIRKEQPDEDQRPRVVVG